MKFNYKLIVNQLKFFTSHFPAVHRTICATRRLYRTWGPMSLDQERGQIHFILFALLEIKLETLIDGGC